MDIFIQNTTSFGKIFITTLVLEKYSIFSPKFGYILVTITLSPGNDGLLPTSLDQTNS
jgi:hypothetical protein